MRFERNIFTEGRQDVDVNMTDDTGIVNKAESSGVTQPGTSVRRSERFKTNYIHDTGTQAQSVVDVSSIDVDFHDNRQAAPPTTGNPVVTGKHNTKWTFLTPDCSI